MGLKRAFDVLLVTLLVVAIFAPWQWLVVTLAVVGIFALWQWVAGGVA